MKRLGALARSPLGRLIAAAVGIGGVTLLVQRSGPTQVWAALTAASALFPLVVLCEGVTAACEAVAVYLLFGEDRKKLPAAIMVRSGLIVTAVMALAPFGRAVAEATRAAMLSKFTSGPKAASVAARMQGLTLLGNAVIAVPCTIGAVIALGATWLPLALAGIFVANLVLGSAVFLAGKKWKLGTRLNARVRAGGEWGAAFDEHLQVANPFETGPLIWLSAGRAAQTLERMILVAAVGGGFGLVPGLVAQGISLISGAVGDLIPGQVGISEGAYTLAAGVLSLPPSSAIAIALLNHLAVFVWVAVGSLVPLVWPPPKV